MNLKGKEDSRNVEGGQQISWTKRRADDEGEGKLLLKEGEGSPPKGRKKN